MTWASCCGVTASLRGSSSRRRPRGRTAPMRAAPGAWVESHPRAKHARGKRLGVWPCRSVSVESGGSPPDSRPVVEASVLRTAWRCSCSSTRSGGRDVITRRARRSLSRATGRPGQLTRRRDVRQIAAMKSPSPRVMRPVWSSVPGARWLGPFKRDCPRAIDRHIDYFGGDLPPSAGWPGEAEGMRPEGPRRCRRSPRF